MIRSDNSEGRSQAESNSKCSDYSSKKRPIHKKGHHNRKKPEQDNDSYPMEKMDGFRQMPTFGLLESEHQKWNRLDQFFREEIDQHYRKEITSYERQAIVTLIEQPVKSLTDILRPNCQRIWGEKVSLNELIQYCELVDELKGHSYSTIRNQHGLYLAVFEQKNYLSKLLRVSEEEAEMLCKREKFMQKLELRQRQYNQRHSSSQKLSQASRQIAFLHSLWVKNNQQLKGRLRELLNKIDAEEPEVEEKVEQKYIKFLTLKNIYDGLQDHPIDYLNFFKNLDQTEGSNEAAEHKPIVDKKQFENFIRRKKNKKSRKSKNILRTACAACFSAHFETYNPLLYCPDCQIRFHKHCYTPTTIQNLCQACYLRRVSLFPKSRFIECFLCSCKGLMFIPISNANSTLNVHIFCMIINGLWKYEDHTFKFDESRTEQMKRKQSQCVLCKANNVYIYECQKCGKAAHPLCAFLGGWRMSVICDNFDEIYLKIMSADEIQGECKSMEISLRCCGIDLEENEKRRKFILNYKRYVYSQYD